eukprot:7481552-Karenia_brevis.AAC.1
MTAANAMSGKGRRMRGGDNFSNFAQLGVHVEDFHDLSLNTKSGNVLWQPVIFLLSLLPRP